MGRAIQLLAVLCYTLFQAGAAAAAQPLVVENTAPSYRFELPRGFQACPASDGLAVGSAKYSFVQKHAGKKPVYLFVQHLGETMPQNIAHDGKFPADIAPFHPSVFREKWKGFDLYCLRYLVEEADKSTICFGVIIPLKAEAIRLDFQAPADQEHDLDIAMKQILPTLDGETNWNLPKPEEETQDKKGATNRNLPKSEEQTQDKKGAPDSEESASSGRLAVGLKGLAALVVVVGLVALVVSRRRREPPISSVRTRPKAPLLGGRKPDEPRR